MFYMFCHFCVFLCFIFYSTASNHLSYFTACMYVWYIFIKRDLIWFDLKWKCELSWSCVCVCVCRKHHYVSLAGLFSVFQLSICLCVAPEHWRHAHRFAGAVPPGDFVAHGRPEMRLSTSCSWNSCRASSSVHVVPIHTEHPWTLLYVEGIWAHSQTAHTAAHTSHMLATAETRYDSTRCTDGLYIVLLHTTTDETGLETAADTSHMLATAETRYHSTRCTDVQSYVDHPLFLLYKWNACTRCRHEETWPLPTRCWTVRRRYVFIFWQSPTRNESLLQLLAWYGLAMGKLM